MEIKLLPANQPVPLAILSMTNLDNRELNPAVEKQLSERHLSPAQPQSALGDLLQVIGDRHQVAMQAWDAALIGDRPVDVQLTADQVTLRLAATPLPPDLDSKSSQVLVLIGAPHVTDEVVHATGQELQRKLKAFFGIQARLQFRTLGSASQVLDTIKPVS